MRPRAVVRVCTSLTAAALLAVAAACSPPELGDAPFLCNTGSPKCPTGYDCLNNVCVREGKSPPDLDSGPRPDKATPKKDGRPPDRDLTKQPDTTSKGDKAPKNDTVPPADVSTAKDYGGPVLVLITEFMANPEAVYDSVGEWIELYNPGPQPVNINGWTLKDLGTDLHVIANGGPLMVPSKGFVVLGASTDKTQNGNVSVAYAFKNIAIANSADEIYLLDNNGKTIDSFAYSTAKGFNIPKAASLSVKYPNADKNLASSWCVETSPWPGSKGDKGTPGMNPGCK